MRTFGAACFSLLLSVIPATASDPSLKEEIGKIASAYEQHFGKKDAAGITSLFTKDYLRVAATGVVTDNTKYYENAFAMGLNRLEVRLIPYHGQERQGRSNRLHRCLDVPQCS
jgi:hypothetical protein